MAVTCTNCGYAYNSDDAEYCAICNASFQAGTDIVAGSDGRNIYEPERRTSAVDRSGRSSATDAGVQAGRPGRPDSPRSQASERRTGNNAGTLEGRISHTERNDERLPRDIYRFMAKLLIGILFFIPYLGLFFATAGLSLAFAVIGFRSLSQLLNPFVWSTSVFELLEIIVLRRIRGTDTIPVYRGMVEDRDSREYSFVFRGPIRVGNLVAGHNIRLFGSWERGTFVSRAGMDLTSNSEIVSEYRNPWRFVFYFMVVVYIFIGLGVFFSAPQMAGAFG